MSNSQASNLKLYSVSAVTLVGSAFVAAGFVVPSLQSYAKSESTRYTVAAIKGQGSEAVIDYQLAASLDNHNEAAAVGLARVYLALGRSDEAMRLLERIGKNQGGLRLRAQTLTELGKYEQARSTVGTLLVHGNEGDSLLAAAIYKLGNYNAELGGLDSRLTSVEALQALSRIRAGNLPLALELRALGLPVSSSTLLMKLPNSTPRNLALGEMLLAKGDKDSLSQAADYLSAGIKLDPSSVELRTVFANVLRAQKKTIEADEQDKLILRLRQGKL